MNSTMVKTSEALFSCKLCDKSYNIKASYSSHMRIKHPNQKKNSQEDPKEETIRKESDTSIMMMIMEEATRPRFWYENEDDDMISRSVSPPPKLPPQNVSTQELEKLLPRPESRDSMLSQFLEAERMLEVRDIQPDWFNTSFDSVYAENLRQSSMILKCINCDKNSSEMSRMRKHLDGVTVKANIFFKKTEAQKKLLRNEIKKMSDKVSDDKDCRQCPMRASVEEDQARAIQSKDVELEELKKQMKTIRERNMSILVDQKKMKRERKELEKNKKDQENSLKEIRDVNNDIIKNNATLKIELKRKDDIIKGLKELSVVEENENEDDEEEIVVMEKETSGSVCLTCDKTFPEKRSLDQHMQAKHNLAECPICDEAYPQGKILEKHTDECMMSMDEGIECPTCMNKFLTKRALKRHITRIHKKPIGNFVCSHCEMIFNNENEMRSHMEKCMQEVQPEKSKEVCIHWRRGYCKRGDGCGYSHVGHQLKINSAPHSTKLTSYTPACKHGQSCVWLAKGSCSYFHKNIGVQKPWNLKEKRENTHQNTHMVKTTRALGGSQPSGRRECKYGAQCNNLFSCTFLHSLVDFPNLQKENQNSRTMRNQNRRQ